MPPILRPHPSLAQPLFKLDQERPNERTGQPAVLEHEDQDRDPDAGDLRGALLAVNWRARRGAACLWTDAEDLKTVGKGLESMLLTDFIP